MDTASTTRAAEGKTDGLLTEYLFIKQDVNTL